MMYILDAPIGGDCPALDPVHVVEQRARLERASFIDKLLVRWLGIASLVSRTALDNGWRAIPDPREAEARLRNRQHRVLQRREAPILAAIGRDFDPGDLSAAGPGETGDLVKSGSWQVHLARWKGDHRFRFHCEGEDPRLAGLSDQICVFRRLFARVKWFFTDFKPS